MAYYNTCSHCGAHLDPGEVCDCRAGMKEKLKAEIMSLTDKQAELVLAGVKIHNQCPKLTPRECVERAAQAMKEVAP